MKANELKETSTEDLIKLQKQKGMTTGFLAGILLVLFATTLYSSFRNKEFDVMMVVPIALSAILFSSYNTLKNIKKELSERK